MAQKVIFIMMIYIANEISESLSLPTDIYPSPYHLRGFDSIYQTHFPEFSVDHNIDNSLNTLKSGPSIHQTESLRYTKTPIKTYQVHEEVYEPKPVPKLAQLGKTAFQPPNSQKLVLGSGSLGVSNFGNGHFALGSGSLGFSNEEAIGGLHVVPPPKLVGTGGADSFEVSFDNKFQHAPSFYTKIDEFY